MASSTPHPTGASQRRVSRALARKRPSLRPWELLMQSYRPPGRTALARVRAPDLRRLDLPEMEAEADGFVIAQRAEVDMPVGLEDDAASADARADHAAQRPLVLRQPLERGVKRLAQPGAGRAGIDMDDDVVALAVEHELRLAGPPQFREVGAEQEEAV